jgi:hypothetical protein
MVVEGEQLLARVSIPHLAGSIVATSDELVAAFVERAICQRQEMSSQHFKEAEALLLVLLLFLYQIIDELLELWIARLGDQWLLLYDLVVKSVNISSNKFQNYRG